jgi:NAD(P)H-hydrate epimerase
MATASSGDVFFGLIAGLCAAPLDDIGDSAIFAAYLHGMAGDLAAKKLGMEALTAGAIVRHLGAAYKKLRTIDMFDMPF